MCATVLSWLSAACMTLAVAACGTDKASGLVALYDTPGPSARLIVGQTTQTETNQILGPPWIEQKGVLTCCGFSGSTLGVMPPGAPAMRWQYTASRVQTVGFWPFEQQRGFSRTLLVVFDGRGVVHDVKVVDNDGQWYATPKMRMF